MRNFFAAAFLAAPLTLANAQAAGDPFIDNAKAGLQLRSMYFDRDLPNGVAQETWATMAGLWGRTGYWRDIFAVGGTLYVDVPFYGPDDKDGGKLLKPGQKGFSVFGEAYAKLKYDEQFLTLYRQRLGVNPQTAAGVRSLNIDTNFLGSRDIRMVPLTYEAAMFNGAMTNTLNYQAGYVDKVKDLNADKFVSMSRFAGSTKNDTGMWTGGLQWNPVKDLWVQGLYYEVKDTFRTAYADVDWVSRIDKDSYWRVAGQYMDQRSDGANLLTGVAFKTWNAGLYSEYGWRWLKLYGAISSTGSGEQIRSPYSDGPVYIVRRIKTFERAGEDAMMAGTIFDFASFGLPGFSIELNAADGRHAIDAVKHTALPKWREYDTDFVYRFQKDSPLANARIRFRWATLREDFGSRVDRTDDTRLDFNWAIEFN